MSRRNTFGMNDANDAVVEVAGWKLGQQGNSFQGVQTSRSESRFKYTNYIVYLTWRSF